MTQTLMTPALWPLLLARLRHLLLVEGLGYGSHRYPGSVPVAARSRTGRQLIALGAAAVQRLSADWPEVETLPVWPDLCRVVSEGAPDGADPEPVTGTFAESLLDPRLDDPRAVAEQLIRRLVYLHADEFHGLSIGLMTLGRAWRGLRSVPAIDVHLLEHYLDCGNPVAKRVIRFFLKDLGSAAEWEGASDADWFRGIARRMDRYPLTLAGASSSRLARFKAAGIVSESFPIAPSPPVEPQIRSGSAGEPDAVAGGVRADEDLMPRYRLADGRFVSEDRFPGSLGHALDIGADQDTGLPVLITKLFVLRHEPLPARAALALDHEGIAPLLYLGRAQLPQRLANVLVEALPRTGRGAVRPPVPLPRALVLADRVAAIIARVHAAGGRVLGLRPELTFVDEQDQVVLAPRGDHLRRLTWPQGPEVETHEAPFPDCYIAPEILMGAPPTPAGDLFSLCAMLTYWITGAHPFTRDGAAAQLRAMLTEPPECHGLPARLAGPVARGLSPDPRRRPSLAQLRGLFIAGYHS